MAARDTESILTDAQERRRNDDAAAALIEAAATPLRRALVARFGLTDGCDAAAAAMAWAWEHRDELAAMHNPVGYLYRVGRSSLRSEHRWRRRRAELVPDRTVAAPSEVDDDLLDALAGLTADQRVAVVLVHMYAFTYREVAAITGHPETAITNHVSRGLRRLRQMLR